MKLTWWDKLCIGFYVLYLVCRYGLKGAEKITDDRHKRLLEKLNDKILF